MQTTTVKLYSLEFANAKTYLAAALFAVGNILLPQLCHQVHLGGPTWLPIYFFTLVGACKYGWRVGLLTAVVSPLVNSLLFGMPAAAALVPILFKSVILALAAGWAAPRFGRLSPGVMAGGIPASPGGGAPGEGAVGRDFRAAMQDFRLGVPGMLVQLFGGWAVINYVIRK